MVSGHITRLIAVVHLRLPAKSAGSEILLSFLIFMYLIKHFPADLIHYLKFTEIAMPERSIMELLSDGCFLTHANLLRLEKFNLKWKRAISPSAYLK